MAKSTSNVTQAALSDELCQVVLDLYQLETGISALTGQKKAVTVGDATHGNGAVGAWFAALTVKYKDTPLGDPTDKRSGFSVPAFDTHIDQAKANVYTYASKQEGAKFDKDGKVDIHFPKCWGQYVSDCRRFIGLGVAKEVYSTNNVPIGILKIKSLGLEAKAQADAKNNPWLKAKMVLAEAKDLVSGFDKARPGENHEILKARRQALIDAISEFSKGVDKVRAQREVIKEVQPITATVDRAIIAQVKQTPVVDEVPAPKVRRSNRQAVAQAA
jgi:hypothetical protein